MGNPVRNYMLNVNVNGDTLPLSILVMDILVIIVVGIPAWTPGIFSYQKLHRKGKSRIVCAIAILTFLNKQTKNINISEKKSRINISSKFLYIYLIQHCEKIPFSTESPRIFSLGEYHE